MVDTHRSWTELQAILADNTLGNISPQDLRDAIISLAPGHGSYSIDTPAETLIDTVNVWKKVAGTTADGLLRNFSNGIDNRLTYDGVPPVHTVISSFFSMMAAGTNKIFEFAIAKNDVIIDASHQSRKIAVAGDVGSASIGGDIDLVNGDYLELWVRNTTDDTNITISHAYFHVGATMKF